jgi:hypothetical protein
MRKESECAHALPASPARATQPSTAAHYRKPLATPSPISQSPWPIKHSNGVTRAIVNGESISEYMKATRDGNEQKIRDLRRTGDQRHFLLNDRET